MGTTAADIFGTPAPKKAQSISDIFAEQDEQNRRQETATVRSIVNGVQHSPDQAAEAVSLARRTGVPSDTALRNLDFVRRISSAGEFDADTFVRDNPVTSRWLTADPINAAVARDDFESLSALERITGRGTLADNFLRAFGSSIVGTGGGVAPVPGIQAKAANAQRGTVGAAYDVGTASIEESIILGTTHPKELRADPNMQARLNASRARQVELPDPTNLFERSLRSAAGGFVPSMAYIGGESVLGAAQGFGAGVALGAVGGPASGVTGGLGMAVGARVRGYNAYRILMAGEQMRMLSEMRDVNGESLDEDLQWAIAQTSGAGLALLGMYGFDKAIGLVGRGATRVAAAAVGTGTARALTTRSAARVGYEVSKTVLGTVALETAQETLEQAGLIAGESIGRMLGNARGQNFDPVDNVIAELGATAVETALGAVWLGGLGGIGAGAVGMTRLQQAQEDADRLGELVGVREASNLAKRDPTKFREVVAQMVEGGMEKVGIDAERLVMLLQEQSVSAAQFAQVAGITEQDIATAQAVGGDVYIPTANLLADVVGTPIFEGMKPDLKLRPDGMSQREADAMAKEVEAESAKIQEEMEAIVQNGTEDASGQRVIDELVTQITAATEGQPKSKRFTEANIEQTARGIAAFYITQAQRTGVDAYELYASRGYSILGRQQGEGLYDAVQELRRLRTEGTPEQVKEAEAKVRQQGELLQQAAFHGTPHTFDRFDLSKIGTGEGAQAYGHGLYFAENVGVAEGYRRSLSRDAMTYEGQPIPKFASLEGLSTDTPLQVAVATLANNAMDREMAKGVISQLARRAMTPEKQAQYAEALSLLDTIDESKIEAGNLYQVDIPDAAVATYLDWDKPLSEQAPIVREALAAFAGKDANDLTDSFWEQLGGVFYKAVYFWNPDAMLEQGGNGPREASLALLSAGIRGIKYLDAGSRGTTGGEIVFVEKQKDGWVARVKVSNRGGVVFAAPTDTFTTSKPYATEAEARAWAEDAINTGTRNLVVFDESDVTITHRNGEPVTAQERTDFLAQEGGPSADILMQTASVRSGVETLEEFGLDPKKTYTNREVATALERRQREKYGTIGREDRSPEAMKRIAEWMVAEVEFEMQNPEGSGIGWYSEKFQAALDALGQEFPEMVEGGTLPNGDTLTRQGARDLVTAIVAITSDGADVQDNLKLAVGVYRNFRETGTFELQRGHPRESSFKGNLADITKMYRDYGADGMREVLLETKTIKELKVIAKARGMKFESDYQVTMRMPMSAVIFGEKLGAFYANLMGQANYLTMDRWWSRTFNRYRGTLLTVPTEAGLERFKELLEADAKALAKSTKTPVPVIDEEQIVSAVIKYQQEYEERGFKTELAILVGKQQPSGKAATEKWMAEAEAKAGKKFDSLYQLHELERAANTLSKAMFESLEDAPFSAKDRTFMIDTVAQARTFLGEKGFDVSPADLQAILWYYEKKLYGQLTRKKGKGTKGVSYADAARVALDATRPGGPADAGVPAGVADGRDVADGVAGEAAIFGDEAEAVEAGDKPFRADILEQGTGRPNAFIVPGVGQQTIALMNGANLSSLLHEFSHDWLVILGEQAAKPDAPAQVKADYAELLKQLGVASTAEVGVEQQENFARMWERYYATAEAPSRALARVFTSFKRWMQKVYKDVREMFVPVSPEVSRLFDRMIATDAELELARGANGSGAMLTEKDGETLGATPDEMEGYAKAVLWRTAQEEARLIKAVVEDEGKETTEQYQAEAESVRAEVRAELEAQPVYRAFKFLREPDANGKSVKLNVEQYEAEHGKRPRGLQGIWSTAEKAPFAKKEGADVVGTDAESMALAYGFRDGTAFIDALRAMEDLEVAVERRVREEMRVRFPDLTPFSQPLADEAQRVQHLADTDDVLVRELNLLAKSSGIRAPNVQAVKRAAKAIIAKLKVRDIRPIVYQNAEAKAARLSMEAFKAGDPEKAAFHKRQQLLNHILYREAAKQQERVGVIQRFAKRMMATPTQERMGKAGKVYQDALNSLLQSYDFRNIPLRNLDALEYDRQPRLNKTAALNAYKEAALEDALVVASIPASVSEQEGVVNYQQLSVMELDNVYSVMHQVYETASRKDKALRENEKRNLQEQADAFVESVTSLHTLSERPIDYYPLSLANAKQKLAAVDAWHLPPEFLFVWLDGDTTGTAYTLFFKPFAEAEAEEFRRGEIAFKEMQRIEEMIELPSVLTDVSVQYEGIRSKMTKRSIIALALNMGTESGVRASLEAQVDGKPQFGSYDAILAMFAQTLTEADWKYITAKWDYANTFWPDIAELERQTNGIIPQKLEAAPFFVRTADGKDISVKGGYYPLSYASAKLGAGGAVKVIAQVAGLEEGVISPSGGARAQTMHGWTEERVKASGRPINLDLNVWNGHIVNVIHDLTHRKAVRDVYRLYKRKDVRQAIEQSAGQEAYNALMPWLARIANPNQSFDNSFAENTIARARAGVTAVNMGLSVSVAMVQPLGYLQAADVIGPMWVAKGIAASFSPNFKSVAGAVLGAAAYGSTLGPAGTAVGGLFGAFVGGLDKASADVLERSVAMRQRREDFSRDARDYVKTRKNRLNGFEKFYFSFIGMMDNAVMVPVWIGAYRKAMAENGGNDGEAVQYADSVIRRSQGAGSPKDLSRVQGGPELRRMLTIHYSFMSRQYGLFRRTATNLAEGRMTKARVLASVAMIGVLSPILSELVAGRPPEDDEEWLPWAMLQVMQGAAGSIVLLRDVARALGPKAFPYKISPVEDALKKSVGAIQTVGEQTVGQLFSDEDTDLTESELKEIVETIGYWTRTPTRAVWRVVTSFTDWMQGYDVESADFIRSRPR